MLWGWMRRFLPWLPLVLLFAIIALSVMAGQWLDLNHVKAHFQELQGWRKDHFIPSALIFFICFAVADGAGLPVTALMALMAGALFPLWLAFPLAIFARSLGDIGAFLIARHWLRHLFERRYPTLASKVEKGLAEKGLLYLFMLRLVPGLPPPLVNIGMALTHMPPLAFMLVNALGLTVWTGIYIYAGERLSSLRGMEDIIQPEILLAIGSLAALVFLLHRLRKAKTVPQ